MLKLEKASKNKDLLICMRDRDSLFSRPLWQALGITLFLHIGAFILFRIQIFHLDPLFVFSPVFVKVDQQSGIETTFLSNDEQIGFGLLPPPPVFSMEFPEIPFPVSHHLDLIKKSSELLGATFDSLENRSLQLAHIQSPFPLYYTPVHLFISGPLAEIPLLEGNPNLQGPLDKSIEYVLVKYQVQVDETSGEIFWYDKKQSSGNPKLDQIAEKFLSKLKFAVEDHIPFLTGEIEFILAANGDLTG